MIREFFCFLLMSICISDFGSAYQSPQDKLVLEKVKALPEIKAWLSSKPKAGKADLQLNSPGEGSKYYGIQVGVMEPERFRSYYWLYVDPKNYRIYYWDMLDTANSKITLTQWRYWRNKPGFNKNHYFKNGKLILMK